MILASSHLIRSLIIDSAGTQATPCSQSFILLIESRRSSPSLPGDNFSIRSLTCWHVIAGNLLEYLRKLISHRNLISTFLFKPFQTLATTITMMSAGTPLLCSACDTATTHVCGQCKSARYCSKSCQQANWAVHKLLCKTYFTFDNTSPPTDEHFKAILFPIDSKTPEIVWFDAYESGAIDSILGSGFPSPTASTTPDYDQELSRELPLNTHILYRDTFLVDGSKTNKSLASIGATRAGWYYP